jgi:hypothetical protein
MDLHSSEFRWKMIFVSIFCVLLNFFFFWPKLDSIPFNLDELAWINDGRFYEFLVQGKIEKFDFNAVDSNGNGWGRLGYRSQDQPAIGKFLYGFWITNFFKRNFYQKSYINENFIFVQQKLGGAEMSSLDSFLPKETVQAIQFGRVLAFFIDSLTLILFSFICLRLFRSVFIWIILLITFLVHPLLQKTFLVATTDGLMFFMILFLLSFLLIFKRRMNKTNTLIYSGVLVALATSVKLNGIFFLFPFLFVIQKKVKAVSLLIVSFLIALISFNPELWLHFPISLFQLFLHRINFITRVRRIALPHPLFISDSIQSIFSNFSGIWSLWFVVILSGGFFCYRRYSERISIRIFISFFMVTLFSTWLYYIPGWSRYLAPLTVFFLLMSGYGLIQLKHSFSKHVMPKITLIKKRLSI